MESLQKKADLRDVIAIIVLLINLSAVVWGAAKISSSVDNLKEVTNSLKTNQESQIGTINSIHSRLLLIELRVQKLEEK